ncbi:hypothetical protein PhCBS80983_g01683 [Powellomyces hirtus]|uniref:Galactose oxidase-like Early set domain-containing protein n=1 Tax=Powellomyces hirtus TaxID=109895 RepID=A0A507E917_9FUNG|nr:hypothetical protein PhCBS80983_g01683 [Powellomyces hirtus]
MILGTPALAAAAVLGMATQITAPGDGEFKVVAPNSGVVAVHMSLLPGNKLLLSERFHEIPTEWLGPQLPNGQPNIMFNGNVDLMNFAANSPFYQPNQNLNGFLTDTAEFDLNTMNHTMVRYPAFTGDEGYAFCNGAAQMADGGIMVAGGDQKYLLMYNGQSYTTDGRRDVRIYKNGAYTKVATMAWEPPNKQFSGRWYPTVVGLPNEDVLIMGGHTIYYEPTDPRANNPTYEIYRSSGPNAGKLDAPVALDVLRESFPINMYPITYVLPGSGNLFSLAGNRSAIIDYVGKRETRLPNLPEDNIYPRSFPFAGTNFLEPLTLANKYQAKVWVCGGNTRSAKADGPQWFSNCANCLATAQCYYMEPESEAPKWTGEQMAEARSQPVAINLPDGVVAVFGGSSIGHQGGNAGIPIGGANPTQRVMFFDHREKEPARRWRLGAAAAVPRQYHGSAVLLTDGSVIIGGSDEQNFANQRANPYELRLEAFYPPYFKLENRPALDLKATPTQLGYGQKFIVPFTSDIARNISTVSMIKYGTSTHTMNIDQRMVELEVLHLSTNQMYVVAPPNANIAPPGNWMLWAVDERGAPVVQAATINLRVSNKGPDAAWDDRNDVKPDAGVGVTPDSPTPPAPWDAGTGAQVQNSALPYQRHALASTFLAGLALLAALW